MEEHDSKWQPLSAGNLRGYDFFAQGSPESVTVPRIGQTITLLNDVAAAHIALWSFKDVQTGSF